MELWKLDFIIFAFNFNCISKKILVLFYFKHFFVLKNQIT